MSPKDDPEFELLAMHDPVGRRGLWMKCTETSVQIAGGREGDDDLVTLRVGEPITPKLLRELKEIGQGLRWMLDQFIAERIRRSEPLSDPEYQIFQSFERDVSACYEPDEIERDPSDAKFFAMLREYESRQP